jgi:hypothetical protein
MLYRLTALRLERQFSWMLWEIGRQWCQTAQTGSSCKLRPTTTCFWNNLMQVTYGKGFEVAKNSPTKVQFRQTVLAAQVEMQNMIDSGTAESMLEDCTLKHYFTPKDEKYGCSTYAREIFLPKGSFVIGKIHRHQHLNFISKGKVKVFTEFGEKHFEAPCTFISEVGLKRAVYAEEDTIWTTVHLTEFENESDLDKIEQEVISPTYDDMGLIALANTPLELAAQGGKP